MWRNYTRTLVLFAVSVIVALGALVIVVNPYGNLPPGPRENIVITEVNQRFTYPQIVRSRRYDSLIIGTSTTRPIPPDQLSQLLDMRFAALAMNSATAWEQYRIADLFLRTIPDPKGVLIGIDVVWCTPDADIVRLTHRAFPEWMYDDNPWNDFLYFLNGSSVEIAVRQVAFRLGIRDRFRYGDDGYGVFTPPEDTYDIERARFKIWNGQSPEARVVSPTYVPTDTERLQWQFPALNWLEEILARFPDDATKIVSMMPVHIASQPYAGSREEARETECKRRIAEIANSNGAVVIDFRIRSDLTQEDSNYWDRLHYRIPVAEKLANWIGAFVTTGRPDPNAPYSILTPLTSSGS